MNRTKLIVPIAASIALALVNWSGCASNSGVQPMGSDTFIVTRQAASGFSGAGTLKADAIREAAQFCESRGKVLKVVAVTEAKPPYVLGNFPKAEVVFKALNPGDPELQKATGYNASGTDVRVTTPEVRRDEIKVSIDRATEKDLYEQLAKLGALRKEGVLTEEEFQREKAKLLGK